MDIKKIDDNQEDFKYLDEFILPLIKEVVNRNIYLSNKDISKLREEYRNIKRFEIPTDYYNINFNNLLKDNIESGYLKDMFNFGEFQNLYLIISSYKNYKDIPEGFNEFCRNFYNLLDLMFCLVKVDVVDNDCVHPYNVFDMDIDIDTSCESFLDFSMEESDGNFDDIEKDVESKLMGNLLKYKSDIEKVVVKARYFINRLNIARKAYYKINLINIKSLFSKHGSAEIYCEALRGDPSDFLFKNSVDYVVGILKVITDIKRDYISLMDSLVNSKDITEMTNHVNTFIKESKTKVKASDRTSFMIKAMKIEIKTRMTNAILKSNKHIDPEEYDGEYEFPKSKTTIYSLFIKDPKTNEVGNYRVNDIFSSHKSIEAIGGSKFDNHMEGLFKFISNRNDTGKEVADHRKKISMKIKKYIKANGNDYKKEPNTENKKNVKKNDKLTISLLKKSVWLYVDIIRLYIYGGNLCNFVYTISIRIDRLAKESIKAMKNKKKRVITKDMKMNSDINKMNRGMKVD